MILRCFVLFVFLLTRSWICMSQEYREQEIVEGPQSSSPVYGSTLLLRCKVRNRVGDVQWTRDGFALGIDRSLPHYPRYTMIGDDKEGVYNLQIQSVRMEDDAPYRCQVSRKGDVNETISDVANVTVRKPPDKVYILPVSLPVVAGHEITLECKSTGAKPAAELKWFNENEFMESTFVVTDLPRKLKTTHSTLTFTPTKAHHGVTIRCEAGHSAMSGEPMMDEIRLKVEYSPEVTLKQSTSLIQEGDRVSFQCMADANPSDIVYKWFRNGKSVNPNPASQEIQGTQSLTYNISNIRRDMNGDNISCEANNKRGANRATTILNVHYGPSFKATMLEKVSKKKGENVTIVCDVDGNPPPQILWRKYPNLEDVRSTDAAYNLGFMDVTMEGRYICEAAVTGYPPIQRPVRVVMKGKPKILPELVTVSVSPLEARLECSGKAEPAARVEWSFGGEPLRAGTRFAFEESYTEEIIRHTLIIRELKESDFGAYNCTMTNEFGQDSDIITLRHQRSFPLVKILAGAIGGIIVLIAIIMIIFLCQRKGKLNDGFPEKDSTANHTKPATTLSVARTPSDSELKEGFQTRHIPKGLDPWEDDLGKENFNTYRYSADYIESAFPPPGDGVSNNGYVPYVDYSRDYNPPPSQLSSGGVSSHATPSFSPNLNADPRYSATYANPYLRSSSASLVVGIPVSSSSPNTSSFSPHSSLRNGLAHRVNGNPPQFPPPSSSPSNNSSAGMYITAPHTVRPGTLATHV